MAAIAVHCGKLVWKGLELPTRSPFRIRVMYVLVKKYLHHKGTTGEHEGVIAPLRVLLVGSYIQSFINSTLSSRVISGSARPLCLHVVAEKMGP